MQTFHETRWSWRAARRPVWRGFCSVAALASFVLASGSARAQLTTVHAFTAPNGDKLSEPTETADGNLYATAAAGGRFHAGAVLRFSRSGSVTVIYSFNGGSEGAAPLGGVKLGRDGNLYGTTSTGGASGYGTAFRITTSGTLTTLHAFTLAEGGAPHAPLLPADDGNFYGSTAGEFVVSGPPPVFEARSYGAIFRLTPSGTVTTLHAFTGGDGAQPLGALIQARDGHLYGTTSAVRETVSPHPFNITWGTVFRVTLAGTFTSLYTFHGTDGGNPLGRLLEASDGNLYGTTGFATTWQCPCSNGTLFRISPAGALTTLYTFTFSSPDGSSPETGLVAGDGGNMYGTTSVDGAHGLGTLFRVTPSGSLTTLYSFTAQDGRAPWQLVRGTNGTLYAASRNTLLRSSNRGDVRVLGRVGYALGAAPDGALVLASDRFFYGTTSEGGTFGYGTVYRMSASGEVATIYSFSALEQARTLIEGADGALYYTGLFGGANGFGSIARVTKSGAFSRLYSFDGTNGAPNSPLLQGRDRALYGTTGSGNSSYGAVFRVTTGGAFSLLHAFSDQGDDGSTPYAPLALGSDGSLYGMTLFGGGYERGVAYRVTSTGSYTTLHSFDTPEGATPDAGLVRARDGNFYGTTQTGGPGGGGTVLRLTPAGAVTTLYAFRYNDSTNGWWPDRELVAAQDGSLYSTTVAGGAQGAGTVYKIAPNGAYTLLHSFALLADGSYPLPSSLVQDSRGRLYGTTTEGGSGAAGTIFRVDPP